MGVGVFVRVHSFSFCFLLGSEVRDFFGDVGGCLFLFFGGGGEEGVKWCCVFIVLFLFFVFFVLEEEAERVRVYFAEKRVFWIWEGGWRCFLLFCVARVSSLWW